MAIYYNSSNGPFLISKFLGSGVGSTGNDYSLAPSNVRDGGESGSNGVQERGVDVGEDEAGEETSAITFKGSLQTSLIVNVFPLLLVFSEE